MEWRDNMQALADRAGKPAPGSNGELLMPSPAAVNITASTQLRDLQPAGFALPLLSPPTMLPTAPQLHSGQQQSQQQPRQTLRAQEHWQASNATPPPGVGVCSGVVHGSSVGAATGGQPHWATDQAIISHHAAAINASLAAASSRLAAAGSSAGSGTAAPHRQPHSRGLPSVGGTSATASMHSALSDGGGGDTSSVVSAASTPGSAWHSPEPAAALQQQQASMARSAAGAEAADEPLLGAGAASSNGGVVGSRF